MLETLVSVVYFVRATFYYGFYVSYKAGFVLVNTINTIFKFVLVCLDNFTNFFSALCESLGIFLQDIVQFMQQTFALLTTVCETVYSSVATVILKISLFISSAVTLVSSVSNSFINGITAIYNSIGQTAAVIKHLVILFGSGVWFLITLVPFLLYYLCSLCISFIHGIYQEICNIFCSGVFNVRTLIKNIVLFIIDVPIESAAGLIIALSLAYIFKQFYVLMIPYFKEQLRKLKNWVRQHWHITEIVLEYFRSFTWWMTRQQPIQSPRDLERVRQQPVATRPRVQARTPIRTRRRVREELKNSTAMDDRYCVICQERNKCILLLPCRHLCLCSECLGELRYYNEVCPICRTNIESTMKIFV